MTEPAWVSEIEGRVKAATPGPVRALEWERHVFVAGGALDDDIAEFNFRDEHTVSISKEEAVANAKLFAHAPTDLTRLIAGYRRMREALDSAQACLRHTYDRLVQTDDAAFETLQLTINAEVRAITTALTQDDGL